MSLPWLPRVGALPLTFAVAVAASAGACARPPVAPSNGARLPAKPVAVDDRIDVAPIDAALRAIWAKEGIEPSAPVDDARFLRRVHLDVVGSIPTAAEVDAFLADTAPGKRERAVERLLASPAYAEYWAAYWDEVLMGRDARGPNVDRAAFRGWLKERFAKHTPWDVVVRDLLVATGVNSEGGPRRLPAPPMAAATMDGAAMAASADAEDAADDGGTTNGAVNWFIRYADTPTDLAGLASRTFLGVQIQCAQCHDHKTEAWKQEDFRRFAACFSRVAVKPLDARAPGQLRRVAVVDAPRPVPKIARNPELAPLAKARPAALDGTDLSTGKEPRAALASWIVAKDNPYFAKAIVNRMWGHFLGRGFVDPVDDLRPSNAPVMPALFDALARDFVDHGFDLPRLVRLITKTEAYARSAGPAGHLDPSNAYWARFRLTPLGPEELLQSVFVATGMDSARRANGRPAAEQMRAQLYRQYGFLFDTDEEQDQRDYEGSVAQALALINGSLVESGVSFTSGGAVATIAQGPGADAEKIDALYKRILSRPPGATERALWLDALAQAAKGRPSDGAARGRKAMDGRRAVFEDMAWALLNSSEFLFNH